MASYCDHWMSVIHHVSSVVCHAMHKGHLFLNNWLYFNKTWQEFFFKKNRRTAGVIQGYIKSTFSEYGRVAYQFKGIEAYNSMLADLTHILDTRGGGGKMSFFKVVMFYVKLTGMKQRAQSKQIFCHYIHPRPRYGVKRSNNFVLKSSAYQIK